jgi:hypothetical protein
VGLLGRLLLLPLAPVQGVVWLGEQIQRLADQEMNDPAVLQRKLQEAQDAYVGGDITEYEYRAFEEAVLERLLASPDQSTLPEVDDG